MTELLNEPELEQETEESPEEESFRDQVKEALFEESEDTEPEVASTESPEPEPEEELPSAQASEETPEEQELRWARVVAKELKENPELGDALVALKQGKAKLLPNEVLEAIQAAKPEEKPEVEEEPDFWEDPDQAWKREVERRKQLEERLETFESQQRQTFEAQQRAAYESNANLFGETVDEYRRSHPELSDDDMVTIINSAAEAGFVVKYKSQHGDNRRALSEAFEAARRVEFPQHIQSPEEIARNQRSKRRAGAAAASPRTSQRLRPEEPTKPGFDGIKEFFASQLQEASEANQ